MIKIGKILGIVLSLVVFSTLAISCKKPSNVAKEEFKLEDTKQNYVIPIQKLAVVSLVENGSTGYSWHYLVSDENILLFNSEETITTTGDKNIVGAPMVHNWKFKAIAPGNVTLKFAYCREWEAKSLEAKLPEDAKFPRLRAFAAKWKASIETREYTVTVK
jgi:predicted secreted protein